MVRFRFVRAFGYVYPWALPFAFTSILWTCGVSSTLQAQESNQDSDQEFSSVSFEDVVDVPDEERSDAAFGPYFDIELLREAVGSMDSSLLTDLALRLVEGERVLGRPRRKLNSRQMLDLSYRMAIANRDKESMERLEIACSKMNDTEMTAKIAQTKELLGKSRAAEPQWKVFTMPDQDQASEILKLAIHDIEVSKFLGDNESLESTAERFSIASLSDSDRKLLEEFINAAKISSKDSLALEPSVVEALSSDSRNTSLVALGGAIGSVAKSYVMKSLSSGKFPTSGNENWGNKLEKKIWNPVRFKHEKISKNHGLWTKWDISLDNPQDNLQIEVRNIRKASSTSVAFQVYVRTRSRAKFTAEHWSWGVKLASEGFNARCDVKVWVDIEVKITPIGLTKFKVNTVSNKAEIKYENLVFDKFGAFGGATAELLGRTVETAYRGWFSKNYNDMRNVVANAIREACTKESPVYQPIKKYLGI